MRIFLLFTFILFWSFVTGQNVTPDQLTTSTGILGRSSGTGPVNILDASTTKTFLNLNNVENTALSTWGGTSNITTLGTIVTGVWNGTDIAYANIDQGSALSVLGVAGNATADVASIVAASDGQVLRRSGTSIGFGALNLTTAGTVTGLSNTQILYGGSGGQVQQSANLVYDYTNHRLNLGTPSSLDGVFNIKGTGTGSGTYAIKTQNSANTLRFYVTDDGTAAMYHLANPAGSGQSLDIQNPIDVFLQTAYTATSGTTTTNQFRATFSPASGTGLFNLITLTPTINQGTGTGITRSLFITPVLTVAANHRAIETAAGTVLFGDGSLSPGGGNVARLASFGFGTSSSTFSASFFDGAGSSVLSVRDDGKIGIHTTSPSYTLDFQSSTDGMRVPIGTTAQRPGSTPAGVVRYNSTDNVLEVGTGSAWTQLGAGGGSGDITNGGNTTGAAITIGTNDAFGLNLETNNTTRFSISGGSSTGGAIVSTDVSANTNSVEIMTTKIVNSTGVAATGFGNETLYQLETSTTNSQDAAAIDVLWSDATHATRTSDIVFRTVASATALSEAMRIGGTDYKLTLTSATSNTNTAVDRILIQTNSTGTPTSSFGGQIKFVGKSSTTNNRDMGSVGATWTTATDASRTSAIIFKGVNNAGTMDEIARFEGAASPVLKIASSVGTAGTTTFSNSGITPGTSFILGNNSNTVTVGGSSGIVNISSTATSTTAISISASDNSGTINLGNTAYTSTSLSKTNLKVTDSYTAASGSGSYIAFEIAPTFNLTSTVTGVQRGIYINPTITSLASSSTFRAIDISNNNASSFGIYQSGTSTKNIFAGKNAFGSTTAATEVMEITGNSKTTGQYYSALYTLTDAATIALDWNNGNVQAVTLGGNRTFTFANPKGGARYSIIIKQDATGSRTITWPTIKWAGGTTPTLTTTANKYDIVTFIYDGTSYFGTISTNF